jgi:hypothetical protein
MMFLRGGFAGSYNDPPRLHLDSQPSRRSAEKGGAAASCSLRGDLVDLSASGGSGVLGNGYSESNGWSGITRSSGFICDGSCF